MLAENLKTILTRKVLAKSNSDSVTTLEEKSVMKVEITQMPPEAVTANLRHIGELSGVGTGPWRQLCDYLIVCRNGNESVAILVELKKNLKGDNKGQEQLRRSLPLLKYLRSVCHIEFDKNRHETLTVKYFLIGQKNASRLDKQRVRSDSRIGREQYKNIDVYTFIGSSISFDEIISYLFQKDGIRSTSTV